MRLDPNLDVADRRAFSWMPLNILDRPIPTRLKETTGH